MKKNKENIIISFKDFALIKKASLFLYFLMFSVALYGQGNQFYQNNLNIKNISTKEGLSQRSVVNILQDEQGFLWFGTRYGLNKYDGTSFESYHYNSEDDNSLSHNRITSLSLDHQGKLWVGTLKGLNLYNSKENNFTRIQKNKNEGEYYDNTIREIVPIDSAHIWIASIDGLDKLNTETFNVVNISSKEKNRLNSNNILSILDDKSGCLWICTEKEIEVYNYRKDEIKTYKYPKNNSPKLAKNSVIELFKDKDENIWLGYHGGLAFFNKVTRKFEDYKIKSEVVIDNPVRSICQDKEGLFWVGSYSGLYKVDLENKSVYKYQHDENNSNSISQNSIYSIFEDSRGDLWVGSWGGGINYIDRNSNNFFTITSGIGESHLNYKVVSSIIEDDNSNLWIGTEGGGLNFYNINNQSFTYYANTDGNTLGLKSNNIKDIIKDYDGNLWVGTHGGGLNYINLNGDSSKNEHYYNFQNNTSGLSDNKITTLVEDSNRNIWVGTNEGGLNFLNTKEKEFTRISDPKSILGSFIFTIKKSLDSNIIYVGGQKGLAKINVNDKALEQINFRGKPQGPFSVNQVISLYEASKYNLWIGTEGDGLYNYNLKTNESTSYGLKEGLPNEVIYAILPDNKGDIWVSTNKGISRIELKSGRVQNFDEFDGLQGNEFNYEACLKTKNGELIFGGSNGVTLFNPNTIVDNEDFMPPVHINGFKVRNKPYQENVKASDEIKLAYNQNDFSFDFVALGYSNTKKNQYAYKLEGFDSDWNYIGSQRTATYTNINPGSYKFRVKASNSSGLWGGQTEAILIQIKKPLWGTWWAYLGYVIILLGFTLIIRKYSLLRVRDKNQLRQERIDREHVEEVNRLKLQLFTNISHDFRTPLTLIIGPLKRLIDKNHNDENIQKQLSGMYRNATILLQLINQLLDFRKSESGKLKLQAAKTNMVPFLKTIKLSFEELADERHINYNFYSDCDSHDVWFDTIEMKKVVLNILSNAFKFTPAHGEISLQVSVGNEEDEELGHLKILIIDNGKGIREEDIPHIFDRYFQLGQHHELRSGTGVGLALARDIVTLHKGKIYVDSRERHGTKFTVLLPLGNGHLTGDEMVSHEETEDDFVNVLDQYNPSVINLGWIGNEGETQEVFVNESLSTILLIEDNIEVRSFVKDIFDRKYNVYEANNGEEGIKIAQSLSIDLIISDVMMPKMDGLDMCHQLKSDVKTSHIPILLLTARTSSKVQTKGYRIGADVYLTKPFDAQTLKLQVDNILKSREQLIAKFKKDILLEPKEITVVSTDEIFLKRAMEIIELNLSNSEFNVNSFAENLAMSRTVVYKKIKALTGQSISEFIRTIRFKKASQLLRNTDMSISEIVYDVGFNDLKYFRKCFKVVFKETPSQHRLSFERNEVI